MSGSGRSLDLLGGHRGGRGIKMGKKIFYDGRETLKDRMRKNRVPPGKGWWGRGEATQKTKKNIPEKDVETEKEPLAIVKTPAKPAHRKKIGGGPVIRKRRKGSVLFV